MFCLSDRRQVGQIVIDRRICQCVPRGQGMSRIPNWKLHQENNMLLGSLEVLESAGLTGLTRASVKFL